MHKQFVPRLVSIVTATTAIMWMSGVALPSAQRSETDFRAYTRFHLSDHRPLWAEFQTA